MRFTHIKTFFVGAAILMVGLVGSLETAYAALDTRTVVLTRNLHKSSKKALKIKADIVRGLRATAHIVPAKNYKRAARKARIKSRKFTERSSIKEIGSKVDATHVLVISKRRVRVAKRSKKRRTLLDVKLVEVASGQAVFDEQYRVRGRNPGKSLRRRVAREVGEVLDTLATDETDFSGYAYEEQVKVERQRLSPGAFVTLKPDAALDPYFVNGKQ